MQSGFWMVGSPNRLAEWESFPSGVGNGRQLRYGEFRDHRWSDALVMTLKAGAWPCGAKFGKQAAGLRVK